MSDRRWRLTCWFMLNGVAVWLIVVHHHAAGFWWGYLAATLVMIGNAYWTRARRPATPTPEAP